MNITVHRNALLKPLQAISGVIDKKQSQPILANVLLSTKDNQLCLTGTDLEMELVGTVPLLSMTEPGRTTVSARKLFDICRVLPEDAILSLSLGKNNLLLRSGESCFTLKTLPAEEFPNLENHIYATELTVSEAGLKQLLTKTYFAMGEQDVRHYLNGILLDIKQKKIQCVAMDGHRLAFAAIHEDRIDHVEMQALLPRKSVLELMRLLENDSDADMTLRVNEQRICVTAKHFIFTSKLIHARYPDYQRVIPQGATTVVLERDAIKQALIRAAILSNEKFRGVRLQLENNRLLISANNAEQEQVEEVVSLDYAGNAMEVGFNVSYLLDAISTLSSAAIRFIFTDAQGGLLIRSETDEPHFYVVMPMRF
ncbi:MAG: DNA polymerase III subunit beta [Gammaproteobacteria bacterium RIFCSPHIGHO2_12_FULL_42_10]|nr:MAG: DNA polymerase III subunit beta [Gammaproteobacteria bacterium RIFCSPHIGHO2_12_FULL_42_10]